MSSASIKSKHKSSPFKLRVNITSRGVFFDRQDGKQKALMVCVSEKSARRLAQWILDNTEES